MIHTITVTESDISDLQETVQRLPVGTYPNSPEYAPYSVMLTDTGSPLDFFLLVHDLWTYNDYEDNNIDYIGEQKDYIIKNLNYKTAFISSLTNEKKEEYKKDIGKYKKDLEEWTEKQAEELQEDGGAELLHAEYQKELDDFYDDFYKNFINGDCRDDGAIELLKKNGDYKKVEYRNKEDILTLTFDDELDEERTTEQVKKSLLQWGKRRREEQARENREKIEKRKKATEENKNKHEEYIAWENQKILDELSK